MFLYYERPESSRGTQVLPRFRTAQIQNPRSQIQNRLRTKPTLHLCGVLLGLLVAARAGNQAPAQNAPAKAPSYERPQEVAALDAMLPTLVPPETGAALTADELVQVSRLLASPCDQLRWLLARAQTLADQAAHERDAAELAKAAAARAQALAPLELTGACAEVPAALQEIMRRQQPLIGVTDPDRLIELLKKAERLTEQPAGAKFVLLSRGVPAAKLLTRGTPETWDLPRIVMDRLAGQIELPPTWELLDAYARLGDAYQKWAAADAAQFGDAAQQQSVKATFQIAAALLDRALGLDDPDLKGLTRPVPYGNNPEDWARLAEALEGEALWRWATLAHVLAASPASGQPAPAASVSRAQQLWGNVRKLSPEGWRALDDAAGGWLPRLGTVDRTVQPNALPLTRDFQAAARAQRAAQEREIQRLVEEAGKSSEEAARPQAVDALFAAIQSAKAADLGTALKPLTLAELQAQLGDLQPLYLFVELAELRGGDGGTSRVCGVAVYRQYYRKPQQGVKAEDRYLARTLPLKPSAAEVVAEALANGPPLMEGGAIRKDARIIIAQDGPPARAWFDFETKSLLKPTAWTGADPSWVVYVPSATALSGGWSLDATLRVWYRAALRMGGDLPIVSSPPQTLAARNAGPPLDREDMGLFLVAWGAPYGGTENKLADLLSVKRAKPVPALPLWVKK